MLTIAWDVDDVLNDLTKQWLDFEWLPAHPDCTLRYEDLRLNPPHDLLGVEKAVYLQSLDRFRASARAKDLLPNPGVSAWLQEYGHRCRHLALTARPLDTAPDLAHWVMHHFGNWIRCFGILPSRFHEGVPVYDRTKGEFLRWIEAGDILIDDSPQNCRDAEAAGIRALAYPQPWSGSTQTIAEFFEHITELVNKR